MTSKCLKSVTPWRLVLADVQSVWNASQHRSIAAPHDHPGWKYGKEFRWERFSWMHHNSNNSDGSSSSGERLCCDSCQCKYLGGNMEWISKTEFYPVVAFGSQRLRNRQKKHTQQVSILHVVSSWASKRFEVQFASEQRRQHFFQVFPHMSFLYFSHRCVFQLWFFHLTSVVCFSTVAQAIEKLHLNFLCVCYSCYTIQNNKATLKHFS